MPKEYIERGAILDAIAEGHGKRNDTQEGTAIEIWDEIKKIPAADVVEVVRCKDCIGKSNWYKNDYGCTICGPSGLYVVEDNSFCSYGERKEK